MYKFPAKKNDYDTAYQQLDLFSLPAVKKLNFIILQRWISSLWQQTYDLEDAMKLRGNKNQQKETKNEEWFWKHSSF